MKYLYLWTKKLIYFISFKLKKRVMTVDEINVLHCSTKYLHIKNIISFIICFLIEKNKHDKKL